MVLPTETTTAAGEATFGRKLILIIILWIIVTVAIGILLVLASPWLTGL